MTHLGLSRHYSRAILTPAASTSQGGHLSPVCFTLDPAELEIAMKGKCWQKAGSDRAAAEGKRAAVAAQLFAEIDTNKDGKLSQKEVDAMFELSHCARYYDPAAFQPGGPRLMGARLAARDSTRRASSRCCLKKA